MRIRWPTIVNIESELAFKNYTQDLNINTDNNMVIGIPFESWGTPPEPGDEIAALGENGQLVGKTIFHGGFTAITIYGDDQYTPNIVENLSNGESFSIALWDANKDQTMHYQFKNWLQGDEYFSNKKIAVVGNANHENIAESNVTIEVYPNPTSGYFFLHIDSDENTEANVCVYDQSGSSVFEEIFQVSIGEQQKKINLSELAQGTYTLSLRTNNLYKQTSIVISK